MVKNKHIMSCSLQIPCSFYW